MLACFQWNGKTGEARNQVYGVLASAGNAAIPAAVETSGAATISVEAVPEPGPLGMMLAGSELLYSQSDTGFQPVRLSTQSTEHRLEARVTLGRLIALPQAQEV